MVKKMGLAAIIGVGLASLFWVLRPSDAQLSCDDPFRDAGELRFPTRYWEKTDFCKHSVPYSEIRSGGVAPDGIPPIDDPQFESITAAAAWLEDQSPVIALEIEGQARAYPLAILIWHEIVNDTLAQTPIAITFCPLCNSSLVFERQVAGQILRFGVSGNLRNSDLIMWDDQTQSWWQQFTGEGIVGFYTGTQLTIRASQVVSFADFAAAYPQGQVLSRDTGVNRDYGSNPYSGYDSTPQPFLFEGEIDARLPPMEHVLGAFLGDQAIAYPFSVLAQERLINTTLADLPVVVLWQPGVVSALDQRQIDASRDMGTAALFQREVEGQTLTFALDAQNRLHDTQTDSTWNVFGQAIAGPLAGTQLRRQIAGVYFWFAWAAFRPDTAIYGQ